MEWIYTEDEYGTYGKLMDGETVVAESTKYKKKWHDENPPELPQLTLVPLEDRVTDLEVTSVDTLNAIAEVYEETIIQSDEATAGMIATAEVFEYVLSLEEQLLQLKAELQELKGSGI